MKILFAAAEAYPLIKTGGLGDIASGLPSALASLGASVCLLLPAYPEAKAKAKATGKSIALSNPLGAGEASLIEASMPDSGVNVLLVDCKTLYERPGTPYGDTDGHGWPDNHLRFALLSFAAAMISAGGAFGFRPDILHVNDWHTGLAPLYLKKSKKARPPSVFAIHNLHYQGIFEPNLLRSIGLDSHDFTIGGVEYHGKISFMKAGIQYADRITTVSRTYAREILRPETGEGLHGLLGARVNVLRGILNGADYKLWNPDQDEAIAAKYSATRLGGKAKCKLALQRQMGLAERSDAPLLGLISRFADQKGIGILLGALDGLFALGCQLVVLGSGEPWFEAALRSAAKDFPKQAAAVIGYDEELAHRIQAGADMLLVPSLFEPCGLTQLYALKYGTLPVVRRTGGLADTVVDFQEGAAGTGIVFGEAASAGLLFAVKRGIELYRRPSDWRRVQKNAMKQDFGWQTAANEYMSLYNEMLREKA